MWRTSDADHYKISLLFYTEQNLENQERFSGFNVRDLGGHFYFSRSVVLIFIFSYVCAYMKLSAALTQKCKHLLFLLEYVSLYANKQSGERLYTCTPLIKVLSYNLGAELMQINDRY